MYARKYLNHLLVIIALIGAGPIRAAEPEFTQAQLQYAGIVRVFLRQGVFLNIDRPQTSYPRIKVSRDLFYAMPHDVRQEGTRAVLAFMSTVDPLAHTVLIIDESEREIGAVQVGHGLTLYDRP